MPAGEEWRDCRCLAQNQREILRQLAEGLMFVLLIQIGLFPV